MTDGRDPTDWTVLSTGKGTGSVTCGAYRGWYSKAAGGALQITWAGEPEEGPPMPVERAAREACIRTDGADPASKSGRLDAGG